MTERKPLGGARQPRLISSSVRGEPTRAEDDPLIGRTFGHGFVIKRFVGQGGMGRVYEAEQTALERRVAVKFLQAQLLRDELSTRRFYTEARAASRLSHANSVAIFDFGVTDEGVPFLVMEYLAGDDLGVVLHREGPLPEARVAAIALAILAALGEAHALGMCHRDLKPENVLVLPPRDGVERVKVVDFGLAQLAVDAHLTDPGMILRTPLYMAPEHFMTEELDGRADLYSLGVMMFELLTGRLPSAGEEPLALAQVMTPPPDPREFVPMDDELAEVVMRALAKRPDDRFPSASAMSEAIRQCSADCSWSMATAKASGTRAVSRSKDPLVNELERAMHHVAVSPAVVVVGRPGSGRSTAVDAFARRCANAGWAVAATDAVHDGRGPGYEPVLGLVNALLGDHALETPPEPLERAGFAELRSPVGLAGFACASRAGAVAAAIVASIRETAGRSRAGRVAVLLDEATFYDCLSLDALERAASSCGGLALFVFITEEGGLAGRLPHAERVTVGAKGLTPLHTGLLRRLGIDPAAENPPDLGSCVAWLAERAEPEARQALAALTVLGLPADAATLGALGCERPNKALGDAVASGLADRDDLGRARLHRAVRDLLDAGVEPSRAAWNDRVLALHTEADAPVEVRAEHALAGSNAFGALLLAERAGAAALRRGDPHAAASFFRRALELARRELASGDETFEAGIVTFSRKLAIALLAADLLVEADGWLAEADGQIAPAHPEKAQVYLLRARIAGRRGRGAVLNHFHHLAESPQAQRDALFRAEVERGLADASIAVPDPEAARAALRRALTALEAGGAPFHERATTALAFGSLGGDTPEERSAARAALEDAATFARHATAPALESACAAALARVLLGEGEVVFAATARARALALALDAGDADAADRLREEDRAAIALSRSPPHSRRPPRRVVLVVEDDPETLETLSDCLSNHGYVVHAAGSGKQALRVLANIERPMAILTDLMMPVMDGWELVATLRENSAYASIPIAIVSAIEDQGPADVPRLGKPIHLPDVLAFLGASERVGLALKKE